MRILYVIFLISFLIFKNAYSKIINIENINLEVPESHIYIEYTNDEVEDFFQEFTNTSNIKIC